jgi:uncharacterized protein (DUF433 family)
MATNGTAMSDDPYVAEYLGVCGGYPVIRETRIPVRLVVQLSRTGATLQELAEMWPTVTAAQTDRHGGADPRRARLLRAPSTSC